jgi:radical SAM protein with 4Fe4S-binding SPASM domain
MPGRSLPQSSDTSRRHLPLLDQARAVDRRTRPIVAVWELTLRCDLACRHCSSRAGRPRPDELTTDEALDVVDQLGELGVLEVTLIGGEAYLRDDWLRIVEAITRRGIECTMVTGGRALTLERARGARDAGVRSVSVSIDGLEATHDALRGLRGSHAAALQAIDNISSAGLQVSANTQVARPNRRELPQLFEALLGHSIHSWQVQLTVAMGRAADHPELLLEPYHLIEVMPAIARIKRRADERGVTLWPGNNLGYFGPYAAALHSGSALGHYPSCGAGSTTLGIESNGNIKGCPSLPSRAYVGGSIREHRLRDIWERAEPLRFTRARTTDELWGYCRDCYYATKCIGGCSWMAHTVLGRRGNNPYCHHRALELLRAGKRERVIRTEAPEGMPFDVGKFEVVLEDWPVAELPRARAVAGGDEVWLSDSL